MEHHANSPTDAIRTGHGTVLLWEGVLPSALDTFRQLVLNQLNNVFDDCTPMPLCANPLCLHVEQFESSLCSSSASLSLVSKGYIPHVVQQ